MLLKRLEFCQSPPPHSAQPSAEGVRSVSECSSFLNQALSFLLPDQPLKATGEKWPSWPVATEDAGSAPGAQPQASTPFPHSFPGRCESQAALKLGRVGRTHLGKQKGRQRRALKSRTVWMPSREGRKAKISRVELENC